MLAIGDNSHEGNLDLCLASRAFGAANITFAGKKDPKLVRFCSQLNKKWGSTFAVNFTDDWKVFLNSKRNYKKIYLTRYGLPVNKVVHTLKTYKNILLIITLSDSIKSLHQISDFNVSITTQPHCSSAAIAVFLHAFYEGRELAMHFENAKFKVVPDERNIRVERAGR